MDLSGMDLSGMDLSGADFSGTVLDGANLGEANLTGADLSEANLRGADLRRANLTGADLTFATLVMTDCEGATLSGCRVYGISAWDVKLQGAIQSNLVITHGSEEPAIQVDNLEVAQFVYLLQNNKKIREVIGTIGKKAVPDSRSIHAGAKGGTRHNT
jgi:hypothetical protein